MAALEKEREKLRQLQQLSERRRSILQEGNDTKNQLQTEYARLTDLYQAYVDELSKPEYHPEGEISVIARISSMLRSLIASPAALTGEGT